MTTTECSHHAQTIEQQGYAGCVAPLDCHASAHGWKTETQRCTCGAERRININQDHTEYGPWGPSEQERQAIVARCFAAVPAQRVRVGDAVYTVHVGPDGALEIYRTNALFALVVPVCVGRKVLYSGEGDVAREVALAYDFSALLAVERRAKSFF